tara:strand:+ start:11144 stop:12340 length:1197 start_codon:yes stop_codon:yes gene_type:complete
VTEGRKNDATYAASFDCEIKVLVFSGFFLPGFKGGGPIKTIKNLCDQSDGIVKFNVVTSDRDLSDDSPYESVIGGAWNQVGDYCVFYTQPGFSGLLQMALELCRRKYNIIYLNSFFSLRFSFFPGLLARVFRQKIVLAPRGEFSGGALAIKPLRKRIFVAVFNLFRLNRHMTFQASSDFEAEDIRRILGRGSDIRIAENIGAREFADLPEANTCASLRVVFVSRISPKKNLFFALEILKEAQQSLIFHIYGPIEDQQYWAQCQKKIKELPEHVQVNYLGPLSPKEVVNTIAGYDVFFMPTKGENYGHVIAEALCAGLPLLIADTTPWRDLHKKGLGWDLPLANPEAFASVLDELAVMPPEEHLKMRRSVLAWAKQKFSQQDAIEANIAMFRYAYEKKH